MPVITRDIGESFLNPVTFSVKYLGESGFSLIIFCCPYYCLEPKKKMLSIFFLFSSFQRNVPFTEWFQLEPVQSYYKSIPLEVFMERLAPER